jgi:hypothetical protein
MICSNARLVRRAKVRVLSLSERRACARDRWPMITRSVETRRNGSTPMSSKGARRRRKRNSCASVESTRWPVSAALIASDAVSLSRISPTMIISGSWRTSERKPLANVNPISGRTCVWFTRCHLVFDRIFDGRNIYVRRVHDIEEAYRVSSICRRRSGRS